jgi:5'-methylthioadenosine/S-adenosylhomocysteine nucleosidase
MTKKIAIVAAMTHEVEYYNEFYKDNPNVSVFQSGMGLVNCAAQTQHIIDTISPDIMIMTGIAGGLRNVKTGDIVIADKLEYIYSDNQVIAEDYPNLTSFSPTPELLEQALESYNAESGTIASSNYLITPGRFEQALEQTKAIAVDMESAAFAHIATKNSIPFLVVRTISDMCNRDVIFDSPENLAQIKTIIEVLSVKTTEFISKLAMKTKSTD